MVLKVSLNTGINRIRLEFKVCFSFQLLFVFDGINRIRLEFKGYSVYHDRDRFESINRIRLEFKVVCNIPFVIQNGVLIESDWNLK